MDNQDYNNQNTNGQDFNQGNDNPVNNQGYDNQQNYTAQPQQPNAQQNYTAQPQQYNAQPYQAEVPQKKNDGNAIASLVLGIVSIVCCNPLFAASIVGLVLGIKSRNANPDNNSMATAGIILSCIGIVVGIIAIIVAVVNFSNGSRVNYY